MQTPPAAEYFPPAKRSWASPPHMIFKPSDAALTALDRLHVSSKARAFYVTRPGL